jgi:hypothetical protein
MELEPDRPLGIDSIWNDAVGFFTATPVGDLTAWLLVSFSTNSYQPLQGPDRGSSYTHITNLVSHCDLATQEKVKAATVRGISEWRRASHPLSVLSALCFVASDLHASGAIPLIRYHLDQGGLGNSAAPHLVNVSPAEIDKIGRQLVSVVRGFAPSPEAHEALEVLFESPRISPRFSGQLFMGLCACRPATFWRHVDRFLDRLEAHPEYFVRTSAAREFVRLVPASIILQGLDRCSFSTRVRCLHLLTDGENPVLDLHLVNDDLGVVTEDGTIGILPMGRTPDLTIMAAAYRSRSRQLTSHGVVPRLLDDLPIHLTSSTPLPPRLRN